MISQLDGFDWDDANTAKVQSHGVSIAEIEGLFHGELHVFPDVAHSQSEQRYLAIGRSPKRRHIFVAFTFRAYGSKRYIRPISAPYMHAKEVKHYEAQIAQPRE